ncbi:MAG: nucleotidyltransferase family protein [Tepidisphaeraceae bacterium]
MSTPHRTINVAAIVPAAGRSGRMGTPKQLLPIEGRPMLLGVVDALLAGGVCRATIVANATIRQDFPALAPLVGVAINDDPRTDMIDSVRIGLESSPGADGYLICPCDAAGITPADVRKCIDAFAETPDRIVIATHVGRRGHPMIFPASLAPAVRSRECDTGLNHLARNRPQLVREVACDSPGTIANINTPADYERLA